MEQRNLKEPSTAETNSSGKQITKDDNIVASTKLKPVMTSMQQPSSKLITLSIAKPKLLQKNMDHYVMKTVKEKRNTDTGVEESETIDFILTDNEKEDNRIEDITEEFLLSDDDDDNQELSNADSAEEIVEHVCGKCFKSFRRIKSLQKHLDFCRFDSSYHLRKAEMLKNLEKIEKDSVIMEKKDVCSCCGESYDTCHLGHITCPDCPKSFKTQISYERHVFLTHSEFDDYPCSICNAKLRSANLLKLHEQQHRIRGKPFACKLCSKDFTRYYHLIRHQKYSSCSASNGDSISCKVCNRAFNRIDNLKVHLKQHLGTEVLKKTEYACPICKKCFYSPSTLNIHTRTHTGERPFDCDLCEKKFPSLVALKKHRRSHTGEKPYTCLVCKQSFATKEVLNRHMKRHTGERPHVCSQCGKSFIQAVELRSHIKSHLRPYECDQCPEKFKTEKQLARHVKEHNIQKKRKRAHSANRCNICRIGFKTDLDFENHMQENIHTAPAERRKRKTRTDCEVCKVSFDTVQNLQFHMLKVHQEDPAKLVNENSHNSEQQNNKTDIHLMPSPKVIKIEDTQGERGEFVTKINKGEILETDTQSLQQQKDTEITNNMEEEQNKVKTLKEYVLEENLLASANVSKQTLFLANEAFTIIPLESNGGIIEPITTKTLATILSPVSKKKQRKTLAKSLAAAIADDNDTKEDEEKKQAFSEENLKLKDNVNKLLNMLVDSVTLKKFGWPNVTEEIALCKVIQNCGHDLSKDQHTYSRYDYATRIREYVKLLFTVVIHNDSIKELLNNYPIDEVIEYVLDNDDDDDENNDNNDENKNQTIKQERTYS